MSWSSNQLLELLVIFCTADNIRYVAYKIRTCSVLAESKSGPVRPESMSTTLSFLITPLQAFTLLFVPTFYIFALIYYQLQRPSWMDALALPDVVFGMRVEGMWQNAVRVLACFASIALQRLLDDAFEHLGDQFHAIGRREKQRIVQTGPYAWVRHPMYAMVLVQEALYSLVIWSYVPLIALVATAIVFAVKIPIEEETIQRDEAMKGEYRAYMQKVPSRMMPYIW